MDYNATQRRKIAHLEICLNKDVELGDAGFDDVTFLHNALPEVNLEETDTSTKFFGKKLSVPLMISAVTGGIPNAGLINKELAKIAEEKCIGFGLGSQRAMIEKPEMKSTYCVRDVAPKTLIFGNIGIVQTKKYAPSQVQKMADETQIDALCVHLNPAQEAFQVNGDLDFTECFGSLKTLCRNLSMPVVGKEVGNGISRETAETLKKAGVRAIDVGGYGGTSWMKVEALRSGMDWKPFKRHGIPTAASVLETKTSGLPIIATGGIRDGLHIAKAIALGASICGIALPAIRVLNALGPDGLRAYIDQLQRELRTVMFLNGCKNIDELKKANYVLHGRLLEWAKQRELLKTL
ncbi:MAG: type 2 isopentenyl-diphosphate Delta-isomerase [archaeon]